MRERRHKPADQEHLQDARSAVVEVREFGAKVKNVLGEGETARDPRRIDESVDRTIEVAASHPEDHQNSERLARFFNHRSLNCRSEEVVRGARAA